MTGAFKLRKMIWALPLALSLFGVLMIASVTSKGGASVDLYGTTGRQVFALAAGFVLMFGLSTVSLSFWKKYSFVFWILGIGAVVATLIPGIGMRAGGATRWLRVGPFVVQPLEALTLVVPIYLSKRLSTSQKSPFDTFVWVTLAVILFSVAPLMFQPNLGGTILIVLLCISIHVESRGWFYPLIGGAGLAAVAVSLIFSVGYRMRRVTAFLDPWSDPLNVGFQAIQGKIAFANGGVLGVGIGNGLQKLNYLPAAHTDYIFSVIGEELGLLGTLGVLAMFFAWFSVVWKLYKQQTDPFVSALTWGIAASVALPLFINLGGVLSLMPLTGIPMPFISYGGSSLLFMWAKLGILARIAIETRG